MTDPVCDPEPHDPWDAVCVHVPRLRGEEFETGVLDERPGRACTVVAFLGPDPASRRTAEAIETAARNGRTVVRMDAEADDVRPLCERFALFAVPALYLFQGGRLKSIFRGKASPEMIETWIGYEAGPLPHRHG